MTTYDDRAPDPSRDTNTVLERRVAWRRTYQLLGDLLVEGLTVSRLDALRTLPSLTEFLPGAPRPAPLDPAFTPYASMVVDARDRVGRAQARKLLATTHAVLGLPLPVDPSPDHLGQALRLIASLIDAELEALTHEDDEDATTLRRWQARVLDEALLPWMAALLAAIRGQPPSLWTRAVKLAAVVLTMHSGSELDAPAQAQLAGTGRPLGSDRAAS